MIDAQERLRRALDDVIPDPSRPTTPSTAAERTASSDVDHDVLSFHAASGAKTTTRPAVQSSEGTR